MIPVETFRDDGLLNKWLANCNVPANLISAINRHETNREVVDGIVKLATKAGGLEQRVNIAEASLDGLKRQLQVESDGRAHTVVAMSKQSEELGQEKRENARLRGEKVRLIADKANQDELHRIATQSWQRSQTSLTVRIQQVEGENKKIRDECDRLKASLKQVESSRDDIAERNNAFETEHLSACRNYRSETKQYQQHLKQKVDERDKKIKSLNDKLLTLQSECRNFISEQNLAILSSTEAEKEVTKLREELEERKSLVNRLAQELETTWSFFRGQLGRIKATVTERSDELQRRPANLHIVNERKFLGDFAAMIAQTIDRLRSPLPSSAHRDQQSAAADLGALLVVAPLSNKHENVVAEFDDDSIDLS